MSDEYAPAEATSRFLAALRGAFAVSRASVSAPALIEIGPVSTDKRTATRARLNRLGVVRRKNISLPRVLSLERPLPLEEEPA